MAVTVNTLGTNSRQIVITGETSASNIINAVNTSLVALGWTLIDTVTSGSRGCLTTKVYSAPNADSVTTKYMIIRYDLPRQYWFVSCAENWNTTTNVATNESWSGGRNILLPLQYSNCILYVFATARYACFMGTVRGEPSAWQGVFEFERSAAEDIAAKTVPCFGWTSSLTIGEPYGNFVVPTASVPIISATSANNGPVAIGFAPPRTANGLTGLSAANNFVLMTGLGEYPIQKSFMTSDYNSGGITQTINSHCGMIGAFGENMSNYVWDLNSSVISNLKLAGYNQFYPTGKIFGLKITGKLGNPLDTTIIPVDANLFYSPTGTNTTHCLLGIHGGYKDKLSAGTNKLSPTVYNSGTALGTPYQSVIVSGRFVYMTTSTGFHKFDNITLTFVYNVLPAGAFTGVKFDGENSLYVSTGTATLYKLNVTDDTYTTLVAASAVSAIALDDTYLYAVGNGTSLSFTVVRKISLTTFTQVTQANLFFSAVGNGITHITTADYAGYAYIGSLNMTTQGTGRIFRFYSVDDTSSFVSPAALTVGNPVAGAQPVFFDGDFIYFVVGCNSGGTSANQAVFHKVAISTFTITLTAPMSNASYANFNAYGGTVLHGCIEPMSVGGFQLYLLNNNSTAFKIPFSDPRIPAGIQFMPADASTNNFDSTNTTVIGQPATDHCTFYVTNTTQLIRYVGFYRNYNFNGAQTANLLIAQ